MFYKVGIVKDRNKNEKRDKKKPQDRLMSFNIHVILAQIELHAGGMAECMHL